MPEVSGTAIVYKSNNVLLEDGLQKAAVLISEDGKISRIFSNKEFNEIGDVEVVDVGDLVLMPGLVDYHVHIDEPGRTEWEGYWTATQAAAAGGFTTIADMPLNSIPATTNVENLKTKLTAAAGQLHVDVGFWGGVIPGNQADLKPLLANGVVGFKSFLCPSGVDEFPFSTLSDVEKALQILQGTDSVVVFHAELVSKDQNQNDTDTSLGTEYMTFLKTRPPKMETEAVSRVIELCSKYQVRCHIVHLSAAESVHLIRNAKLKGVKITAETCPHYLTFNAEAIPDKATQFKCVPPIRNLQNKERLWAALSAREIDMVVSDHSPTTPEMKHLGKHGDGNFLTAWGGIASLQFGLSIFWTEARKRGFPLADIVHFMSSNPAHLIGLNKTKGHLCVGMDGDLVVWNPHESYEVTESIILHKQKITPYLGMKLDGKVIRTVLRGKTIYEANKPIPEPVGKFVFKQSQKVT